MRRWIVTFGGAGMWPYGPGTAGSLAATALLYGLYLLLAAAGLAPPVLYWTWQAVLVAALLAVSVLSVLLGPWAAAFYGRKDPPSFVLDEVAGICLAALGQPMYEGWRQLSVLLAAFVAFRVFDILKPPPARRLERLPQGWGILLDDLAAGIYANLVCQLVLRWWWQ